MKIVVIGGGSAGISVLVRLKKRLPRAELVLIEPAEKHYYQPLWTLVGAGLAELDETERTEAAYVPSGVTWFQERVAGVLPKEGRVVLENGGLIDYDQLIVAAGLRLAYEEVLGLEEALKHDPMVWTNYDRSYVEKGPPAIQAFTGGPALFTTPDTPLKCGGAPQKIMWVTEEWLTRRGIRQRSTVTLTVPGDRIFGIQKYRTVLERLQAERGVELLPHVHLVELDFARREAIFEDLETRESVTRPYSLLHVTPPQRAPRFILESELADAKNKADPKDQTPVIIGCGIVRGAPSGFVEVDRHTLRHVRFDNVWSLGDSANLPTAKTGAAVRKQAPILVENLAAAIKGEPLPASYNGYTSCPLVVAHDRVILAEFGYDGEVMETFPIDQSKPRLSSWLLKRHLLPEIYWHGMLRGHM